MSTVRISGIEIFEIELSVPDDAPPDVYRGDTVIRVDTDAGVSGYAFAGVERPAFYVDGDPQVLLERVVRPALVGADLFAIEQHLQSSRYGWGPVEHALWDALGKVVGQPVFRLLGGASNTVKAYVTCVWPGEETPGSPMAGNVPVELQAAEAVRLKAAGYKGMKIPASRPEPLANARAIGEIRAAVGPEFALSLDYAGGENPMPGVVWSFDDALAVARELEKHGAAWLEEPLGLGDLDELARLASAVEIPIAGGNTFVGLAPYRELLLRGSYDILQPDVAITGGLLATRKAFALSESFGVPCFVHGDGALAVMAWIQLSAAVGAEWQELGLVAPPLTLEEQWQPATQILEGDTLYEIVDGEIVLPERPGLGFEIDEDALAEAAERALAKPKASRRYPVEHAWVQELVERSARVSG